MSAIKASLIKITPTSFKFLKDVHRRSTKLVKYLRDNEYEARLKKKNYEIFSFHMAKLRTRVEVIVGIHSFYSGFLILLAMQGHCICESFAHFLKK